MARDGARREEKVLEMQESAAGEALWGPCHEGWGVF